MYLYLRRTISGQRNPLIGGQSSLSKVNILGTVCVFVWSSIIVLLCAFQGPRLAHWYHIKCLCEGCFQFLGCHWLIHWHSSLLSLFGSWIFIPKSCLYIDRCVLSSHLIHFQPHKQPACLVKKSNFSLHMMVGQQRRIHRGLAVWRWFPEFWLSRPGLSTQPYTSASRYFFGFVSRSAWYFDVCSIEPGISGIKCEYAVFVRYACST